MGLEALQNLADNPPCRLHLGGQSAAVMNGDRKFLILNPNPRHFGEPISEQPFCPLKDFPFRAQRRGVTPFPTI
jgi:hypothetical protein